MNTAGIVCGLIAVIAYFIGLFTGLNDMEKYIVRLIESRLSEIVGDAQPRPALRAELEELIKRINDGKD